MVSQTSVRSDLLESLQVVSKLLVDGVGKSVGRFTVGQVLLSVEEPSGDFELSGVLHNGNDSLELIRVELSGTGMSIQKTKEGRTYRLLRSTSAFLQTKLAYRRPIPLISVKAYMIFPPPLTLVLSNRRMCCSVKGRYRASGCTRRSVVSFQSFHDTFDILSTRDTLSLLRASMRQPRQPSAQPSLTISLCSHRHLRSTSSRHPLSRLRIFPPLHQPKPKTSTNLERLVSLWRSERHRGSIISLLLCTSSWGMLTF